MGTGRGYCDDGYIMDKELSKLNARITKLENLLKESGVISPVSYWADGTETLVVKTYTQRTYSLLLSLVDKLGYVETFVPAKESHSSIVKKKPMRKSR